jgi:hypothetical protein
MQSRHTCTVLEFNSNLVNSDIHLSYQGPGHTRGGRPGYGPRTGLWDLTGTAPGGAEMGWERGCQTLSKPVPCRKFPFFSCFHRFPTGAQDQRFALGGGQSG